MRQKRLPTIKRNARHVLAVCVCHAPPAVALILNVLRERIMGDVGGHMLSPHALAALSPAFPRILSEPDSASGDGHPYPLWITRIDNDGVNAWPVGPAAHPLRALGVHARRGL